MNLPPALACPVREAGGVTTGDHRIGDAERQFVVDALSRDCGEGRITLDEFSDRVGEVFASRTRADLEAVVADLPGADLPVPATDSRPVVTPTAAPARTKTKRRWAVAVMGGEERRGRWRVGRRTTAVAVMGGVELDLREALLEGPDVEISCFVLMGGVDVIVPEGIPVDFGGFVFMGGRDNSVRDVEPLPSAPRIRVTGWGAMGGVTVTNKPLPDAR